MELYDRGHMIT